MLEKQILILGTAARGGIRSVIEAYETAGFYSSARSRFIATHVEGGMAKRLFTAARAYTLVAWLLFTGRTLLLHMHMSMRGSFWRKFLFLGMARVARVPVIIHLHGSEFAVFYGQSSPWVQCAVRHLFDKASAIVVLSSAWKDFVETLTIKPVNVIGNFVSDRLNVVRLATDRDPRKVLFMGQFGERKGIYDLLPVFASLAKRFPDARLVCGGNGEVEKVRQRVHELAAESSIDVPGWISGDEKTALLHECGIFVLPSYNEGLPMAIIEAMSFSMAVVSTTVGGIPELVSQENGALVTPGDQAQLAEALSTILAMDDEQIAAMGASSRKVYENTFSPQRCMEDMRKIYLNLGVTP